IVTHGFFLADHGIEGTASDQPEATLSATIKAGASVGIGGLVEAGVEGYIKAQVNFDLNDDPNPGTGFYINNDPSQGYAIAPQYDGRIYLDELLNDPECIFTIYGDLTVGLDAYFWIGLNILGGKITIFEARQNFFTATIYDFRFECPDEVPILATLNNGVLNLDLQPQNDDGEVTGDRYMVMQTQLPTGANGANEDYIQVSVRGASNYFRKSDVNKITSSGTAYDDEIVIDGPIGQDINIDLHGGAGNDKLMVSATADKPGVTRKLWGDSGNDTLVGSDFVDELHGGDGDDQIY